MIAASTTIGSFITAGTPEHGALAATVLAWSVWPDVDHGRHSTAKDMWGPVSHLPAHLLGRFAGGHRGATHHALAAVAVAVAVYAARQHPVAMFAVYALTIGMFVAAVDVIVTSVEAAWWQNLAVSLLGSAALVYAGAAWAWLPVAAGLGVLVHIVGDRVRDGSLVEQVLCWGCVAGLVAFPFTG